MIFVGVQTEPAPAGTIVHKATPRGIVCGYAGAGRIHVTSKPEHVTCARCLLGMGRTLEGEQAFQLLGPSISFVAGIQINTDQRAASLVQQKAGRGVAQAVHVYRLARESVGLDRPMYRVVGTLCGAVPTGSEISATKAHEGPENLCPECREAIR